MRSKVSCIVKHQSILGNCFVVSLSLVYEFCIPFQLTLAQFLLIDRELMCFINKGILADFLPDMAPLPVITWLYEEHASVIHSHFPHHTLIPIGEESLIIQVIGKQSK